MSVLNNSNAISAGGAYNITDSLRFRGSQYLTQTLASGSQTTWTWSGWVKRGKLGTSQFLFSTVSGTTEANIRFLSGDTLYVLMYNSGSVVGTLVTTQVFRDPSAWYHIVAVWDTTNATSTDRLRLYVNGTRVTSFSSTTYPTLNQTSRLNSAVPHYIGTYNTSANFYDGYMTEFNFVDGQALDPSYFGETNDNGVWSPKKYTGTYGTNGFYLPMKETTQADGFNTVLYDGTSATQSITGVGFSPDLVWVKSRTSANIHVLHDSVRGATKYLSSDSTSAETTNTNYLTSFDSDGFTFGNASTPNGSGRSYVAWCWDAGSSTVSNTDGTITSSVRANPATGFSIVSFVGNGSAGATVGHGLSSAPKFIMGKNRTDAQSWRGWHTGLTDASYYIDLDSTNAQTSSSGAWNSTAPDSSVVTLGTMNGTNGSSDNMILYCFSEVSGYSKFGSYTGNGSTSGPTVTTGFRPAFVMVKRTDTTGYWIMLDNTRSVDNPVDESLVADLSNAETANNSGVATDFNSNGFEIKSNGSSINASGGTYIYMAFADTRDFQWNFDASGNKNNWTPNNINSNASSETTYDLMSDTPSLADEDTSNYCTLNAVLPNPNSGTFSEANLAWAGASHSGTRGTFGMTSGKWYWEVTNSSGSDNGIGISQDQEALGFLGNAYGWSYYGNGLKYTSGSGSSYGASYTSGDVIGVAFDADAGSLVFYKNGVSQGTAFTGLTSAPYYPAISSYYGSLKLNFGQRPFKYTPPTGYKKLNTFNLPDSDVIDGGKYMNAVTYTGNGSTQSITGVGFSPDLVWMKERSAANSHQVVDTVRGVQNGLFPDLTLAEITYTTHLSSFDSDGFTVGNNPNVNKSGGSFVSWNWRGSDSTAVSNTDGTITSTVSANPTSGFSIVTFTGNGSANQTVGHGLGATPAVVIQKSRTTGTAGWNWLTYHKGLSSPSTNYLLLDTTATPATASGLWNHNATTLGYPTAYATNNGSGQNFVAYCFAEVEGFSKFGSYTGNGSTDGTFVYTGFRPAFVVVKATSSTFNWIYHDYARDPNNPATQVIFNTSGLESTDPTYTPIDMLSNGFKLRGSHQHINYSGWNYIYMAFAENPFKNSLAR